MSFLQDIDEVKSGLIIFRRADVKHRNWYCRVKIPATDRYKVFSLKTPHRELARDKALECDADVRFRLNTGFGTRRCIDLRAWLFVFAYSSVVPMICGVPVAGPRQGDPRAGGKCRP